MSAFGTSAQRLFSHLIELYEMSFSFEARLAYTEHNKEAGPTILLIHGGFATGREWDGVVKLLPQYHLLVPDLPGHGRSQVNGTHFSLHPCVDQIADLTRKLAKGAKAHVIGLSLGAHIGAHLISRHPDIVDQNALLSGYNSYPSLSPTVLATPAWLMSRAEHGLSSPANRKNSMFSDCSLRLCKEVATVITTEDWPQPWPARTLLISAAKKGPLPIADRDDNAQQLEQIGRKGCTATSAYKNHRIRHAWHKEEPQLFADTVLAWLKSAALPDGFIKL